MFERFTEKAIKVIMLAQEEARRLGHNFVGTEQILLGLIGEGTGVAARSLKSMGVTLQDARIEVEKIIGRGSGFVAIEIPFTPRAKRTLENSWNEARLMGVNYIGTEHLMLGLICDNEQEAVAVRVLQNLHIDLVALRETVLSGCPSANSGSLPTEAMIPTDARALSDLIGHYRPDALQVIKGSVSAAHLLGSAAIEPEHIFLSLLADDATIRSALQSLSVDTADARRHLLTLVEPGNASPSTSIPFSARAQRVLEHAWQTAVELEQESVTKESMFLGLLCDEDSVAAVTLKALSADAEKLRSCLTETAKAEVQKAKSRRAQAPGKDQDPSSNASQDRQTLNGTPVTRVVLIIIVVAILSILANIVHR